MKTPRISLLAGSLLCVLALATTSFSQNQPSEASNKAHEASTIAQGKTQILYTGRLLGYFRIPDIQLSGFNRGCPDVMSKTEPASEPAKDFIKLAEEHRWGSVLVGVGDNFAPELNSRVLRKKPDGWAEGKDRFYWEENRNEWVNTEKVDQPLRELLMRGNGTIPTDNVGCFLIRAGFAAVVPGKHDFYFGPERLRQLARFLATEPVRSSNSNAPNQPVHMLGANLTVRTMWEGDAKAPSDKEDPPTFIPGFPKMQELRPDNKLELKLIGLKDGGTVYPWFQGTVVKLAELDDLSIAQLTSKKSFVSIVKLRDDINEIINEIKKNCSDDPRAIKLGYIRDFLETLQSSTFSLCETTSGRPNEISVSLADPCCRVVDTVPQLSDKTLEIYLRFPLPSVHKPLEHFFTVKPGKDYGLCLAYPHSISPGKNVVDTYCLRFSVRVPFFSFPAEAPVEGYKHGDAKSYNHAAPYVLLEKDLKAGRQSDVAIFGVIDPQMRDYVGVLNFAWINHDEDFNTVVSIEEPAEALQQLLAYFERKYREDHSNNEFSGVKVLLAQMSPQHAQALAARIKKRDGTQEFQVIVSGAAEEFSTGGERTEIKWTPPVQHDSGKPYPYPNFLAVPDPYFVTSRDPQYQVSVGSLSITPPNGKENQWMLVSERFRRPALPRTEKESQTTTPKTEPPTAPKFWRLVAKQLDEVCLGQKKDARIGTESDMKQLALCAIQKETGADVALMQQRDFFTGLPAGAGDIGNSNEKLQELLDRILWKGDFLTMLYVPGSALREVARLSDVFDAEDASKLTLADQWQRGLVIAGLRRDPVSGEYLINDVPLDPKRLYSVATTDFIGAGDTGYPDFARAAINPSRKPREFDRRLDTVSSVACRLLAGNCANEVCSEKIVRDSYLDEIRIDPADQRPRKTKLSELARFWHRINFGGPGPIPKSTMATSTPATSASASRSVDQIVQQRLIWERSIQKVALSFSDISNNLSDKEIDGRFRGASEQGVTAKKTRTWDFDFKSRFVLSSHDHELFLSPSVRYKSQHTLDAGGQDLLNQIENVMKIDSGIAFQTRGELPRLAKVLSLHFETPTKLSQTSIKLKTSTIDTNTDVSVPDRLTFRQDRSFTLLPRLGLRWQNRVASFEGGIQDGGEFNAVSGYRFTTDKGGFTECKPDRDRTLEDCVTDTQSGITKLSKTTVLRERLRFRGGLYWDFNVAVPITSILSYAWTDQGDFFPAKLFPGAKVTDTMLRDKSKHQLKFAVFRSLSFGPAFQLLLYQNQVNRDFLAQRQFMFEMEMSFNVFNWRKAGRQIQYSAAEKK